MAKSAETWDQWLPALGPSKALHASVYTTSSSPVSWATYRKLYLKEQAANRVLISALGGEVAAGGAITLLCSSACVRESRCHRSILRELIEQAATAGPVEVSKSTNFAPPAPIVGPNDVSDEP